MKKQKNPVSKIKSISIEGFRAFNTRQEFPVRAINLIFGPNSSGKSALIKGILYSLERGETQQADLSGINPYAKGGQLKKRTSITYELNAAAYTKRFEFKSKSKNYAAWHPKISSAQSISFLTMPGLRIRASQLTYGSAIFSYEGLPERYKKIQKFPYWKHMQSQIRAVFDASSVLHAVPNIKAEKYFKSIKEIIGELLLCEYVHKECNESEREEILEMISSSDIGLFFYKLFTDDDTNEVHYGIQDGIEWAFDEIEEIYNSGDIYSDTALYNLKKNDLSRSDFVKYSVMLMLTATFVIKNIYKLFYNFSSSEIAKLLYLGVERESVDFAIIQNVHLKSPFNQYLRSGECINYCNTWLEKASVPFSLLNPENLVGVKSKNIYIDWRNSPVHIKDLRVNRVFPLKDVGYGLKKLIPVLAAVSYKLNDYDYPEIGKYDLVAIEEPEIHLHPKLQSELGDLFVDNVVEGSGKTYFIETHSENILQRMLRRVREGVIAADAINVLYVHPGVGDEGARVERLEIDDEGEFKTAWPKGFFDSREDDILA